MRRTTSDGERASQDGADGRPTADEVRAHAERWPFRRSGARQSGLWRAYRISEGGWPCIVFQLLAVADGEILGVGVAFPNEWIWTPCTPDGDPVALVEELKGARVALDSLSAASHATVEVVTRERDEARAKLARTTRPATTMGAERNGPLCLLCERREATLRPLVYTKGAWHYHVEICEPCAATCATALSQRSTPPPGVNSFRVFVAPLESLDPNHRERESSRCFMLVCSALTWAGGDAGSTPSEISGFTSCPCVRTQ